MTRKVKWGVVATWLWRCRRLWLHLTHHRPRRKAGTGSGRLWFLRFGAFFFAVSKLSLFCSCPSLSKTALSELCRVCSARNCRIAPSWSFVIRKMVSIINHIFHPFDRSCGYLKHKHLGRRRHHYLLPEQAPEHKGKPTLVLDLDQTLIDSCFEDMNCGHDVVLNVEHENEIIKVFMWKRPGVKEFLKAMAECYELVVFTAAERSYADAALKEIDPDGYVSYRLYKGSCINGSTKDLSKLGRDLKRTIIVDDNPVSYVLNQSNGLPIGRFYYKNHHKDQDLLELIPFLQKAASLSDLTMAVKKWKEFHQII